MKTRIWIVFALVAGLLLAEGFVAPAAADNDQHEWTLVGKGHASGPNGDDGDDGDGGSDVEGDPENWLGGQNRPADQDGGGDLDRFLDLMMDFLHAMTFGLFR